MSSFKRRTSSKQSTIPTGVRALPGPVSTYITSSGIPSLDDILGGGLPLSCSLLILAPDAHSAYGELVQKYFIAQGLASGQDICIVDDRAQDIVAECMWMPGANASQLPLGSAVDDEEDESAKDHDAKIKIAWRYEQMKQFQTTVPSSAQSTDDYGRVFDLTCRIPSPFIDAASASGQLRYVEVASTGTNLPSTRRILQKLQDILGPEEVDPAIRKPLRICIPSLGSMQWGDLEPPELCFFLHSLRTILRHHKYACASLSLPPHLCTDLWGGAGWTQKLGWLSDGCISLSAFTGNISLSAMFPSHHGFVHIHSLPSPYTLVPPSDKFSTLRGLSSSGENNLAFKCMRKRLIFETLHLDLEGGVGERRTTPATTAIVLENETHMGHHHDVPSVAVAAPAVEVQLEQAELAVSKLRVSEVDVEETASTSVAKKPKKKVAFHSDRPDLYDF